MFIIPFLLAIYVDDRDSRIKAYKNMDKHGNRSSMDNKRMFALQTSTRLHKSLYISSESWIFTFVKEYPKRKKNEIYKTKDPLSAIIQSLSWTPTSRRLQNSEIYCVNISHLPVWPLIPFYFANPSCASKLDAVNPMLNLTILNPPS